MARTLKIVVALYLAAGTLALLAIPASVHGWLGIEADPLSAVFAILLALPWSLALDLFGGNDSVAVNMIVLAMGIGLNAVLLATLARWTGNRGKPEHTP